MIYCYGDSITKGIPGLSYTKYIKNKTTKNYGLGGDTLLGLIKRVYSNIDKNPANHYIIQIGTNDILLPFLSNYSDNWRKTVTRIIKRGSVLSDDEEHFYNIYKNFIEDLLSRGKIVTLVTIPCLGETLDSALNLKVNHYNRKILTIGTDTGVDIIDFNNWQKSIIKSHANQSSYFITQSPLRMIWDSALTVFPLFSAHLSKKRGLSTTIDGCHLNQVGARGLATLILNTIK